MHSVNWRLFKKWVKNPLFCYMAVTMDLKKELENVIRPVVENCEAIFVKLTLSGQRRNVLIKVTADTEEGITLEKCRQISKEISDMLFRKDLLHNNYRLEVSSPGLNKPLEMPFEFKRNIGHDLRVIYHENEETKECVGKLLEYVNDALTLEVDKTVIKLSRGDIERAVVKLKW